MSRIAIAPRLIILHQIPVFVIALLAAYFKIRYPMPPTAKAIASHPWEALKRVDFLGSLLLAGWLASPLIAISMKAESTDVNLKWTSPIILTLFGIGAATFIVFLIVELRIAKEPVLPVELLHKRTPIACFVSNLTLSMVMFGNVSDKMVVGEHHSDLHSYMRSPCSTPLSEKCLLREQELTWCPTPSPGW